MLHTLPLRGLLCDKHPLKIKKSSTTINRVWQLFKIKKRALASISTDSYTCTCCRENLHAFHSNDVGNGRKSSDLCQARENMQAVKSAGNQKLRQREIPSTGYASESSRDLFGFQVLPNWLKNKWFFDQRMSHEFCYQLLEMSKPSN